MIPYQLSSSLALAWITKTIDSATHGNNAQISRGISFHDKLVRRVLGT